MTPEMDPGSPDIEFSIDIALQRSGWGGQVTRCHLQAALRTVEPRDEEMVPFSEAEGTEIGLPSTPNSCVHTELSDQGPPVEIGGDGDNWVIAGELIAADEIHLISAERTIVLDQVELETGAVRYEWTECTVEDFPFGEVLALHLPEADGVFIEGFTVEEAFAVGPDVVITEPSGVEQSVFHAQEQDLSLSWRDRHDLPEIRGQAPEVERVVWARNRSIDEHQPFEALGCRPGAEDMVVAASDWALMEANLVGEEAELLVGIQLDTVVQSPPFEAPWGKPISVRSTVSDGGDLMLWSD